MSNQYLYKEYRPIVDTGTVLRQRKVTSTIHERKVGLHEVINSRRINEKPDPRNRTKTTMVRKEIVIVDAKGNIY
jgi:alkylated DNA nucleotide flippase Atl1